MIYIKRHLKTDCLDTLKAECEKVGLVSEDRIITASHNHHLLILGTLYSETGVILADDDGNEYEEKKPIDGFHANLKYKIDVGLNHLAIEANTPTIM